MKHRFLLFVALTAILAFSASCSDDSPPSGDTTAPQPGGSGNLTVAFDGATIFTINWSQGSDDVSAAANLEYRLFSSTSDNIGTAADAEANGTPVGDWAMDISGSTVTGLTSETAYYFNVLVRDEAGNAAAYTALNQSTRKTVELLADINSGGGSVPTDFAVLNNLLYVSADGGSNGEELWVYDPTQAVSVGTNPKELVDLRPGASGSSPGSPIVLNGKLHFSATDATAGQEWFIYDPAQAVSAGTNPELVDFAPGASSSGAFGTSVLNGLLYLAVNDGGGSGQEPWVHDPAQAISVGTNPKMLVDINSGGPGSSPSFYTPLSDRLYFKARDGTTGLELWVYDPALPVSLPTNPSRVADINPGPGDGFKFRIIAFDNRLFLEGDDGSNGRELWIYDPAQATSGSNPLLVDINPGLADSSPSDFAAFNNLLYFRADDGAGNGFELWVYDPTQAISVGTNPKMLADINPGTGSGSPSRLTGFNNLLYFRANDGVGNGNELWVYDPAQAVSAGTNPRLVADINPGAGNSSPDLLSGVELLGRLYFKADDGSTGNELWLLNP